MLESQSRGAGEGRPGRGRGAQDYSLTRPALMLSSYPTPWQSCVPKVATEKPGGPPPPTLGRPDSRGCASHAPLQERVERTHIHSDAPPGEHRYRSASGQGDSPHSVAVTHLSR